jgi:hypothetical protein
MERTNRCASAQVGASRGELHRLHAGGLENLPERVCKQRVAVVDEIASSRQGAVIDIGSVTPGNLPPPSSRRIARKVLIRRYRDGTSSAKSAATFGDVTEPFSGIVPILVRTAVLVFARFLSTAD